MAMADPANVLAIDDIQMITGLNCRIAVAAADDIEALIGRLNTLESAVTEAIDEDEEAELGEVERAARVGRRRAGDQARLLDPRPGGRRGRLRHPLRARRGRDAGPLPRRRRAPRGRARAEADGLRRDLAGQDHERARHRREARAPGRPRQRQRRRAARSTCASRPCRPSAARGRRSASSTRSRRCARSTSSAWTASGRERFEASVAPAATAPCWSPGRPARASRPRSTPRSRSSTSVEKNIITIEDPVEYRIDGDQPDQRQPQGRADLRHRAALDPPRRPRHHHGRRDPRRRDGADRDRGGADRSHGALDAAHQRRPGRDHPAAEDGHRELPDRLGARLRRRPAAGAQALHRTASSAP